MSTHTYTATATREGRWWMVHVPDLDALTQARRLADAEPMARSLIAAILDVPIEDIEVTVTPRLPETVAESLARAAALREQSAKANEAAARESHAAAAGLVSAGIPLRDVGIILGVSHQRAHQLAHSA